MDTILTSITYNLVAYHPAMYYEWEKLFGEFDNVVMSQGNILSMRADAIVSPANSFGYMDGSLDLLYSQHFGWHLEKSLRRVLLDEHDGELPVGQAVVIETGSEQVPYLVSAPTMRVPMNIEKTVNVYLAFRAILRALRDFESKKPGAIRSILIPALGTGEGRMPYERCAWQMYYAYAICALGRVEKMGGLARAVESQIELLK